MSQKGPRVGVVPRGAETWVLSSLLPSLSLLGLAHSLPGGKADPGNFRPSWSLQTVTPVKKAVPPLLCFLQKSWG